MAHPDDVYACKWCMRERGEGLHVTLTNHSPKEGLQFTHLACLYPKPPYFRWIAFTDFEVAFPSAVLLDETVAARKLHARESWPSRQWDEAFQAQQAAIEEDYPAHAHSEAALYRLAIRTARAAKLPLAMAGFGFSVPHGEEVVGLWTQVPLRIDRALEKVKQACAHLT